MEVEHAAHCTYRIRYHTVFVIKYRKRLLDNSVVIFLKQLLQEIGNRYWFKFDAIGCDGDHLHILVSAAPRYAPSRIMQILKSITAKQIFKQFPDLRKELWGGEFWSDGGHIDTVGDGRGLDQIRKYVEQQGNKEDKAQLKLYEF